MCISKRIPAAALLATVASAAWIGLSGCDKAAPTSPSPPPGPTVDMMQMGGPAPIDEKAPFAAGKKVFASNGCGRCHRINGAPGPGSPMMGMGPGGPPGPGPGGPGPGGPGPGSPGFGPGPGPGGPGRGAPDLGKVADDAEHTVEWLSEFIRDPKSKNPDARMPPFPAEKINDEALQSLAEYLASLKSEPDKAAEEKTEEDKPAEK